MLRCGSVLLLATLLVSALPPGAFAHGQSEAAELEWYVMEDEMDDSVYYTGGWDVYQVFFGEAYLVEAGGDGVYWRTVLFGDASAGMPPGEELTATFEFVVGEETVARTVRTMDGESFESDFDALRTDVGDGQVEVYGFVLGEALNLTAGSEVGGFRVTTAYGGDARDAAPGGLFVPGSDGGAEAPVDSRGRLLDAVTLEGPGKYLEVEVQDVGENGFLLKVQSALEEGGQHVDVVVDNATPGWNFSASGPLSVAVEAGGAAQFGLNLQPAAEAGAMVGPLRIDVVTDVGGRATLFAVHAADGVTLVPEGGLSAFESAPLPQEPLETPGPGVVPVLLLLVALAFTDRR